MAYNLFNQLDIFYCERVLRWVTLTSLGMNEKSFQNIQNIKYFHSTLTVCHDAITYKTWIMFIKRTSMFLSTLRKVNAIPPPITNSFTLSNIFRISWILSATFALRQRHSKNGQLRNTHNLQCSSEQPSSNEYLW